MEVQDNVTTGQDQTRRLPICVDLDGTLVRTDTLRWTALRGLGNWQVACMMPFWLLGGRAAFKRSLSRRVPIDAAALPYEERLVEYLREAKRAGRQVILATAADSDIAERVARHVGLFDDVMASNGTTNLKGRHKGDALVARFGRGQFVYAGNDYADLKVWPLAAAAIVVNAPEDLVKSAREQFAIEHEIPRGA